MTRTYCSKVLQTLPKSHNRGCSKQPRYKGGKFGNMEVKWSMYSPYNGLEQRQQSFHNSCEGRCKRATWQWVLEDRLNLLNCLNCFQTFHGPGPGLSRSDWTRRAGQHEKWALSPWPGIARINGKWHANGLRFQYELLATWIHGGHGYWLDTVAYAAVLSHSQCPQLIYHPAHRRQQHLEDSQWSTPTKIDG